MAKQPLDPEAPLNEYEKYLLEKLLDPANLSEKFKKWVLDYVPVNGKFDRATLLGSTALGGMAHLETKRLESAQANVDFTVPAGYTHLELRAFQDNTHGAHGIDIQFNGDTGNNYAWVEEGYLPGTGRTDTESLSQPGIRVGVSYNQSADTGHSPIRATIFDYADTSHYIRTLAEYGGWDGTHFNVRHNMGAWGNTAVVTSLRVLVNGGFNFEAGSVFSLYGLV